jgi:hypothetical protein
MRMVDLRTHIYKRWLDGSEYRAREGSQSSSGRAHSWRMKAEEGGKHLGKAGNATCKATVGGFESDLIFSFFIIGWDQCATTAPLAVWPPPVGKRSSNVRLSDIGSPTHARSHTSVSREDSSPSLILPFLSRMAIFLGGDPFTANFSSSLLFPSKHLTVLWHAMNQGTRT